MYIEDQQRNGHAVIRNGVTLARTRTAKEAAQIIRAFARAAEAGCAPGTNSEADFVRDALPALAGCIS